MERCCQRGTILPFLYNRIILQFRNHCIIFHTMSSTFWISSLLSDSGICSSFSASKMFFLLWQSFNLLFRWYKLISCGTILVEKLVQLISKPWQRRYGQHTAQQLTHPIGIFFFILSIILHLFIDQLF